ncbi:MAG TPA: hypothetical protein VGM94_12825 [Galbitalea sp.]
MLYLVMPTRQMYWTDLLGQDVLDYAALYGKDLGEVDWWKPAERSANDDDVRVALRYGIASTAGIVVDAGHMAVVHRPDSMRQTFRETAAIRAKAAPQTEAVERFIDDHISPGWYESARALDIRVEQSLTRSLAEAEKDAREEISGSAPVDALVDHWKALRGSIPEPI